MTVSKNDICQEEGSFTYNWVAGDTIEKGDVVEMHSDGLAYKGAGTDPFVGVADYAAVAGESFAAYGPSNKVWAKNGVDAAAAAVGDYVEDDTVTTGAFATYTAGFRVGVCIEVDGLDIKVLLY